VLGGSVDDEARRVFGELAGATTPPTAGDLSLLADLAAALVDEPPPQEVPARENRATIDSARMAAGRPLALCNTVTDVLRVAVRASGGDVALAQRSRIRSFARRERRVLLAALDAVVAVQPSSLTDVAPRRERWKRLGERLHPHEHAHHWPHAARVFAVARGEEVARSTIARAESASACGDAVGAADALVPTPGVLLRWADRLLRTARPEDQERVADRIGGALPAASGRLLCSLRSHLEKRTGPTPSDSSSPAPGARTSSRRPATHFRSMPPSVSPTSSTTRSCGAPRARDPRRRPGHPARGAADQREGDGGRARGAPARHDVAAPGARRRAALLRPLAAGGVPDQLRPVAAPARRRVPRGRAGVLDEPAGSWSGALRRRHPRPPTARRSSST
jgi:hypothetical protein